LEDDLLRGLGRDASQHVRGLRELDLLADLGLRDDALGLGQADLGLRDLHVLDDLADREDLDLPALVVEPAAEVLRALVVLLRGREDGVLDGRDDHLGIDVLLPADLFDLLSELACHGFDQFLGNSTSRRPWEILAMGMCATAFSFSRSTVTTPPSTE